MADGKWTMKDDDARRVDLSFGKSNRQSLRELPNYGREMAVDNRSGNSEIRCAFCNSNNLQTGFGGIGEGFGYRSYKCRECGGSSNFVYKDEVHKFFE